MATMTETSQVHLTNVVPQSKTELKVVFGSMTFGKEGAEAARVHTLEDCASVLDVLQKHGHNEVDTARVYGTSEEMLGQLKWQERGLVVGTKLMGNDLQRGLTASLQALQTDKVDLWYLHIPDRKVPYEKTLEAVNELYKAGHFRRFGIANFAAWEVAQICELCDRHGWKKPDVYQGCYNALQRAAEPELFPCLRRYGISFYSFSPQAGGMLTDKYQRDMTEIEPGSRFDPERRQGKNFRGRYWNNAYFDALDVIRPVAKKLGLTTAEAAVRWSSHHSLMKREYGDAVVIGANSAAQLDENLTNLEKGPLPDELVQAFDQGWAIVKGISGQYHM